MKYQVEKHLVCNAQVANLPAKSGFDSGSWLWD